MRQPDPYSASPNKPQPLPVALPAPLGWTSPWCGLIQPWLAGPDPDLTLTLALTSALYVKMWDMGWGACMPGGHSGGWTGVVDGLWL
jgi:hypothetical protein